MKRALFILGGILTLVYILLSTLDTSEYRVEQKLWQMKEQYERIARDPAVVPNKRFEDIIQDYQAIIDRFPSSRYNAEIMLKIAEVYWLKNDFVQTRKIYEETLSRYPENKEICAQAKFNIGLTFEKEDNKTEALAVYNQTFQSFPLTEVGLNVPLYRAQYFLKHKQPNDAKLALQEAVSIYQSMATQYSGTEVEFRSLKLLGAAYLAQDNPQAAVQSYGDALLRLGNSKKVSKRNVEGLIKSINTISLTMLKDYDLPISIYQKFINEYPGHLLNRSLGEMIQAIGTLKQNQNG